MKSPTKAYKQLKRSLTELKPILNRVPLMLCDTNLQHLKVQSFVFLSHAAFEVYVEELSRSVSEEAVRLLNVDGIITKALISMTAWETIAQVDDDIKRKKIKLEVANNFKTFANASKINLHKQIEDNHGIRKVNLRDLLVPIGVDPEIVDMATFAALDALGLKRGHIAHKVKIQREETRSSIIGEVNTILEGLKNYDREACICIEKRMTI